MAKKRKRKKNSSSSSGLIAVLLIIALIIVVIAVYSMYIKHSSPTENENGSAGIAAGQSDSLDSTHQNSFQETDSDSGSSEPATDPSFVSAKTFSPAGTYSCAVSGSVLSIVYQDSNSDESQYESYLWEGTVPENFTISKYSGTNAVFYDETHGYLFLLNGSGAGSNYYHVFYTSDGCQTWTEADSYFQKNNSDSINIMTDNHTVAVLVSGIGYTIPAIAQISYTDQSIHYVQPKKLTELTEMLASLTFRSYSDAGMLNVSYTTFDNKDEQSCSINILNYME